MKIGLPSGVDLLRKSGVKITSRSQKQPFPTRPAVALADGDQGTTTNNQKQDSAIT